MMHVITHVAGYGYADSFGVFVVSVTSLAPAIYKTCLLKIRDQLAKFSRHPIVVAL